MLTAIQTRLSRDADSQRNVILAWLAMVVLVAGIASYALYRPRSNTDLIFYAATVHQWQGLETTAIHSAAIDDARQLLPEAMFNRMITENAYMRIVSVDPEALVQQIPFYSVKVLYPALMLLLSYVGMSLGFASVLISAVAYGALALLVFAWFLRYLAPWWACVTAAALVLSPPFAVLAATESPDALGMLLGLSGLFLILEAGRRDLGMTLLLASVLARPNAVIVVVVVAGALALLTTDVGPRMSWKRAAAWAIAGVAVAELLSIWSHNYGLGTLFYFSTVAYLPYPAAGAPALPLQEILRLYAYKFVTLTSTPIPLFGLIGVLGIRARIDRLTAIRSDPHCMVILAMFATIVLGWLAFPNEPERILVLPFVACAVILVVSIRGRTRPGQTA